MNRTNLQRLNDALDKIEQEIERIENDTDTFLNCYTYQDLERDTEIDSKLSMDLKEHKLNYKLLRDKRDQLLKALESLDKNTSNATPTRSSEEQDSIVTMWQSIIDQSAALGTKIQEEIGKAQKQQEQLDELG